MKLDTQNSEQLIYQNEILKLIVLGGIKLEGLDRMRTTLKIELKNSSVPPVRHNLDLYNDTQTEKLIRKVAEKLEIGTTVIEASLAELTESLEEYRMQRIASDKQEEVTAKVLSADERKSAEDFLKTNNLLQETNSQIGKSGMIGEESNRLLMYLIFTSRKLNQPLHIVSLGASGMGKTHLQEKVGELIPEEDTLSVTCLSENSFYYFGRQELKNKLILIEDLDGAESALYPLRELQSKKRISKTIASKNTKGETRTIHLVVEGPVSVSGCTTREQIYEDNANRSFLIYLDESAAQDQRIMQYQRKLSAGKINEQEEQAAQELMKNCQRILQPIKIINPYAQLLNIPEEVLKPRRTNNHYLQFIEVITYYHQYQREQKVDPKTGEIFIETTLEDIAEANGLLKEILLRKSDELTGACRNYLEAVKKYLANRRKNDSQSGSDFTNVEIRKALKVNHSNQKRYMISLLQFEYIKKEVGNKKKGFTYQVTSMKEYEELQENISSVLDKVLQEVQSSKEVQQHNELLNINVAKEKVQEVHTPPKKVKRTKNNESNNTVKTVLPEYLETYVEWLTAYLGNRKENNSQSGFDFTNQEIYSSSEKSQKTIRNYHKQLIEKEALQIISGNHNMGYTYQLKQV